MRRVDWTPAVLVTATASLTVVAVVFLTTPWLRDGDDAPGPERGRRDLADEVVIWVGDLAPEAAPGAGAPLRVVLSAVWGDAEPDLAHDQLLNEGLSVQPGAPLAYYRLLLFNTAAVERTVALADGALSIRGADAGGDAALASVAARIAAGEAAATPALRRVLESLGTLRETVVVPPGEMASLVVAFDERVDLSSAQGVVFRDGTAFRRRRMPRREFEALLATPDEARVRNL